MSAGREEARVGRLLSALRLLSVGREEDEQVLSASNEFVERLISVITPGSELFSFSETDPSEEREVSASREVVERVLAEGAGPIEDRVILADR